MPDECPSDLSVYREWNDTPPAGRLKHQLASHLEVCDRCHFIAEFSAYAYLCLLRAVERLSRGEHLTTPELAAYLSGALEAEGRRPDGCSTHHSEVQLLLALCPHCYQQANRLYDQCYRREEASVELPLPYHNGVFRTYIRQRDTGFL